MIYKAELKRKLDRFNELESLESFLSDNSSSYTIKIKRRWWSYIFQMYETQIRTIEVDKEIMKEIIKSMLKQCEKEIDDYIERTK